MERLGIPCPIKISLYPKQESPYGGSGTSWSTEAEINFIHLIGTHTSRQCSDTDKLVLLRKYLQAAEKRSDWGKVEKSKVIFAAQKKILDLRQRIDQGAE